MTDHDYPDSERRKFRRVEFRKSVSVFHRARFAIERVVEISEGGLLLQTAGNYEKDEIFEINLEITGERLHTVVGQVVYTFSEGSRRYAGIRFLDTSEKLKLLKAEIQSYIEQLSNPY